MGGPSTMDSSGAFRFVDESLLRELPQLQSLRIAPLRDPVSSRSLGAPSPLEPNASTSRESNAISKANTPKGNLPADTNASLPTVTEFLNAARARKSEPSTESQSSVEPPPKPILPAFVNLRAIERLPFSSSFDDDALNGPRKRRRLDVHAESFSDHLQLPIPQTQREQRPPPFGPFAILNGLNEPPPNAALLPPIEAGSITQLLAKPSRGEGSLDSGISLSVNEPLTDGEPSERREPRLEEILDSTVEDRGVSGENRDDGENENGSVKLDESVEHSKSVDSTVSEKHRSGDGKCTIHAPLDDEPMSPKTRGRSRKNLRKWTEEETIALLRGVVKCGIGNWTTILAQPELKFNKRTASNLKDRFRVCCPWAYHATDPNEATKQLHDSLANALINANPRGSNEAKRIRLPIPRQPSNTESESNLGAGSPANNSHNLSPSSNSSSSTTDTDITHCTNAQLQTPPSTRRTPTLSHKSRSALESLGIPEPHVTTKCKRRSRRPFTSTEDEALLKGYAVHGFQWTLIQQDTRLILGHRRATDLRDRFRTKFPHAYRDGGSVSGKALHSQGRSCASSQETGSGRRDRTPQGALERKTKKHSAATRSQSGTKCPIASISQSNPTPIDPALLLPAPPQGFFEPSTNNPSASSSVPSFPLDEASTTGPSSAAVDSSWEDNTLAPMAWDDLN